MTSFLGRDRSTKDRPPTLTLTTTTSQGNVPERQDTRVSTGSSHCGSEGEQIWDDGDFAFEPQQLRSETMNTDWGAVVDEPVAGPADQPAFDPTNQAHQAGVVQGGQGEEGGEAQND
ncbi:hypothetical protein V865_006040 [Kwoniella europaea PYCC6329]|uniref:Uncharacterized protein n=1 Tax=Kwoniella europaea PYCC6329 TaxID=1423913 RepID=A0AAX4KNI2_9TREE